MASSSDEHESEEIFSDSVNWSDSFDEEASSTSSVESMPHENDPLEIQQLQDTLDPKMQCPCSQEAPNESSSLASSLPDCSDGTTSASEFEYGSSQTESVPNGCEESTPPRNKRQAPPKTPTSTSRSPPRSRPRRLSYSSSPTPVSSRVASKGEPFDPPLFVEPIGPTVSLPVTATAADFFELFFTDEMISHICHQTNLYASQSPPPPNREPWEPLTPEKFKSWLGLIISMGLKVVPATHDYWSTHSIFGCPELTERWPIRKFLIVMHYLHLNDNTTAKKRGEPGYDKLHKVRPIMEALRRKCLQLYRPSRSNSIDEAMVGFKGRSSLKQYLPKKPTKRGYKVWCRCDAENGYLCDFSVYTGREDHTGKREPVGSRVVKNLCQEIRGKGYFVFCDNFFHLHPYFEIFLMTAYMHVELHVKPPEVGQKS